MPLILSTHMYTFEKKTGFSRKTDIRIAKITGFLDFGALVHPSLKNKFPFLFAFCLCLNSSSKSVKICPARRLLDLKLRSAICSESPDLPYHHLGLRIAFLTSCGNPRHSCNRKYCKVRRHSNNRPHWLTLIHPDNNEAHQM